MLPGRNQLVIVLALLALASSPGQPKPQAEAFVAEAAEIIGVVRIGVSLVDYIYKVFKPIISDSDISARDITEKRKIDREILREYKVISSALDRMSQNNEQVRATMLKLKDTIPTIVRRELRLDRIDAVIRSVASSYRTFEFYQEHKDAIEQHTLTDFAEAATSHAEDSIRNSLEELHALVVPRGGVLGGNRGIFEMLAEGLKCESKTVTVQCAICPVMNKVYAVKNETISRPPLRMTL